MAIILRSIMESPFWAVVRSAFSTTKTQRYNQLLTLWLCAFVVGIFPRHYNVARHVVSLLSRALSSARHVDPDCRR
jgi:hypothetical protein